MAINKSQSEYHREYRGSRPSDGEAQNLISNPMSQSFEYAGFDIMFSGWRSPINRFVTVGCWVATRASEPGMWVRVIGGGPAKFYRSKADPIDFSLDTMAAITPWSGNQKILAADALVGLLASLDAELDRERRKE